jgi:hypothetical protein
MEQLNNTLLSHGLIGRQSEILTSLFSEELTIENNDFFVKEGTVCNKIGFILEGMLRYHYTNDTGEEITRWIVLKNDFITSLSSFISQEKSLENIQAIKLSKIIITSHDNWYRLFQKEDS